MLKFWSLSKWKKFLAGYGLSIQTVSIAVAVIVATSVILTLAKWFTRRRRIRAAIKAKEVERKVQANKLEDELDAIGQTDVWNDILQMSFENLSGSLKSGSLKAVDVLRAFQWKSLQVNKKLNCVVAFIEEAVEWAEELDKLPKHERKALHGVPISIKECFSVMNYDSTAGLCHFLFDPCSDDSATVKTMKALGAVPFCLTNVPQTMFSLQCSNPAYGATGNAFDETRDCGGSSGGEGALIGSGGSVLGVGSDIGGSLRNPAVFNGIFSLKPTHGRHISLLLTRAPVKMDPIGIPCVGGFMASSVSALVTAYKSVYNVPNMSFVDPSIVPLPWREAVFDPDKKLKIGYSLEAGNFTPHPGCTRAVREAVELLEKSGHTVVEFDAPPSQFVLDNYLGLVGADKFNGLKKSLDANAFLDSSVVALWLMYFLLKLPDIIRLYVINPCLRLLTKDVFPPTLTTASALQDALHQRDAFVAHYVGEWTRRQIDILITPASLMPAPKKGSLGQMPSAITPYCPWNLFNFPVGIVPITKVNEGDEEALKSLPSNDMFYKNMKKNCQGALGMPLGVQIVGRRFDEELVLSAMTQLETIVAENQT